MGRWLFREPEVLLLDEPTRGIDVAAKFAVYRPDRRARPQGERPRGGLQRGRGADARVRPDRRAVGGAAGSRLRRGEWTEERLLSAAFEGYAGSPAPRGERIP